MKVKCTDKADKHMRQRNTPALLPQLVCRLNTLLARVGDLRVLPKILQYTFVITKTVNPRPKITSSGDSQVALVSHFFEHTHPTWGLCKKRRRTSDLV